MKALDTLEQLCINALQTSSEQPAIQFEGHWVTWGEMRQLADQLAALIAVSGVVDQPTVAFVARNQPSALAAFLGLLAQSCTVRMVYSFQSSEAVAKELERIQPDIVVAAAADFSDAVFSVLSTYKIAAIALSGMQAVSFPGYEKAIRKNPKSASPEVILLTSGTTGLPKPFAINYDTIYKYYTGNAAKIKSYSNADAIPALLYFPVSNISGLYSTLPPLVCGTPIVLLDRFNLDAWVDYVMRYQPTSFGMPPAGYKMLLDANIPASALASIKVMAAGAAPLDPNVQRKFEARYNIPVVLSYGATEFGGPVTKMTLENWQQWGDRKFGTVGKPLPGMEVRIVDVNTYQPVDAGVEGIVEVVSCRMGPAWIRTSDLGVIDEDGFLFLKGRADGAIMRGGFKLLPTTIEQALLKNPQIAMVSVIGLADERLGQVPAAAIVLNPQFSSVTFAEIEAALRQEVPATYIPTQWRLLDELPRTPSMKVDVPAVQRLFQ